MGTLFGISKSRISEILREQTDLLFSLYFYSLFSLENWVRCNDWPRCIGIVDSTEILINAWQGQAFSGKKKAFTLKYQVIVSFNGDVLHIYGPIPGSVHDATIWRESGVGRTLIDARMWVLGDKGYCGVGGVITVPKKRGTRPTVEERTLRYRISRHRIKVENHFSFLKKWKVLSNPWRGSLSEHGKIFGCCEILEHFRRIKY